MTMLVKVSELSGVQLEWAVAKAEGVFVQISNGGWWVFDSDAFSEFRNDYNDSKLQAFQPSTDWAQGGPIIQRERIRLDPRGLWCAAHDSCEWAYYDGPTPLIAAMRCYVASKLGEEVDVPDELLNALEA
jgi:hypothetical protein